MAKSLFEELGGKYERQGDYLILFFATTFCIKLQKVFVGRCTYIL